MHIPHACAYPIAGLKHEHQPPGYPDDHGFIPHGQSVIVTAPAAFRFTFEAAPDRHRRVAELLAGEPLADAGRDTLPELLLDLMRDVGVPTGLRELGYDIEDVDALVEGAMKQQRLLVVAPREAGPEDLGAILRASLSGARSSRPRRRPAPLRSVVTRVLAVSASRDRRVALEAVGDEPERLHDGGGAEVLARVADRDARPRA